MKNLIAFALAGLMAVSTAASVPPAVSVSESLPSSAVVSESSTLEVPAVSSSSDESALSNPEIPPVSESADETASSEPLPGSSSAPAESETEPPTDSSVSTDNGTLAESAKPDDEAETTDNSELLDPEAKSVGAEEAKETEAPQQSEPARFSEELCRDLADEQAGSLMGHYGMEQSASCATIAATLALADYEVSDNLDRNYAMVWAALQSAMEALAADGHTAANCAYQDGAIVVFC